MKGYTFRFYSWIEDDSDFEYEIVIEPLCKDKLIKKMRKLKLKNINGKYTNM